AFEMAKRVEAMGDEVGLVNVPSHLTHMQDISENVLHLSHYIGILSKQEVDDLGPVLRPLTRKEKLHVVWKMAPPERIAELRLTPEKLDHWFDVAASL
ncbi:uncharacterized protein EDB91DRAFT_1034826, partial [Suillus paluster]|uniref:uncharacterized protein n=1 Tax=Suillus paluster TaxID=48578 RepID=UPI001B874769